MKFHTPSCIFFATLASATASAQSTFVALKNGDVIPGYGTVNSISFSDFPVEIADDGTWAYPGTVSNLQGNQSVLIRGGVVTRAQGDATPGVSGSSIYSIAFTSIDSRGEIATDMAFTQPNNGSEGIFRGNSLVVQRGQLSLAAGWPANTAYADLNGVQLNKSNQILLAGQCTINGNPSVNGFLSVLSLDAQNQLLGESLVARTGAQLAGQPGVVSSLASWPGNQSINTAGQVLYSAALVPSPGQDGAVMLWNNGTSSVLARDGQPSVLAGTNWLGLYQSPCAIGDNHWAFLATVSDFRTVIVRDGSVFAAKGQPFSLSGAANETLAALAMSNRCMSANGSLAWYCSTIPSNTAGNEAVFVDNQLVFQKNVTQVGGTTATQMLQSAGSLAISPNGRFVALKCVLGPGVTYAIVIVDRFGGSTTECAGDGSGAQCPCGNFGAAGHGCANSANANGALLTSSGTASVSNDSLVLTASGMPNTPMIFLQGIAAQNAGAGVVFGDGLLCTGSPTIRLGAKVAVGGTTQYPGFGDLSVSIRGQVPPIGGTRIYQAWFRDNGPFCTVSNFNVSNAISVLWMP